MDKNSVWKRSRNRCRNSRNYCHHMSNNACAMNKNFLKLPSKHFWILTKSEKSQLLAELNRRVEVLS